VKSSHAGARGLSRAIVVFLGAVSTIVAAGGAGAEPWHGRWSPNLAWCFQAEGVLPEGLLRLSATEYAVGVEVCQIAEAVIVVPEKRWRLRLACGTADERDIEIEVTNDVLELVTTPPSDPPERYVRCPERG